jgi:uncharacterized protein
MRVAIGIRRLIMAAMEIGTLALAIGLVAFLYSSVGHAGASGYIAVMTLFGVSAGTIKPTALVLNIVVAAIGAVQFFRAGHFKWHLFWPFALLAVPAAFLGGYIQIPPAIFHPLLGCILLFSAWRLFMRKTEPLRIEPPARHTALGAGALIGLLSGATGTGGGIFLTPLLLLRCWAFTRQAAAVSVVFILANSAAGLCGHLASGKSIPTIAWQLAIAAVTGGTVGSYLGSRRFPVRTVTLLLAAVLVMAGGKLLATR